MFPWMQRSRKTETVTIAANAALSEAIDASGYAMIDIRVPDAWTSASIAIKVATSKDGTYIPKRDSVGTLLEISGIATSAAAQYTFPAEISNSMWIKIWSESGGSDQNQAASRSLEVVFSG